MAERHVGYTITLRVYENGNMWWALIGDNIQEGIAGFGEKPSEAIRDLADHIQDYGLNVGKEILR